MLWKIKIRIDKTGTSRDFCYIKWPPYKKSEANKKGSLHKRNDPLFISECAN